MLHPEGFTELDMMVRIKDFSSRFLHYQLTDDQAAGFWPCRIRHERPSESVTPAPAAGDIDMPGGGLVEVVLVVIGIVLLAAAVVGDKLVLGGAEIPQTSSALARGALATLGVVALLLGIFPAGKTGPAPTDGASATPPAPGGVPAALASGDPPAPDEPLWHGTLLFESAIDFDTDPPSVTSDSDAAMDIYAGNDFATGPINQIITLGTSVAKWTRPTAPTAEDCATLLQTHGLDSAHFGGGDQFCVRSGGAERLVFLSFPGQPGDHWEIEATVWQPRD